MNESIKFTKRLSNIYQIDISDANSTSSSNESVSSNSKEGGNNFLTNHISPEKGKRTNIGMPYPKSYKSQGAV